MRIIPWAFRGRGLRVNFVGEKLGTFFLSKVPNFFINFICFLSIMTAFLRTYLLLLLLLQKRLQLQSYLPLGYFQYLQYLLKYDLLCFIWLFSTKIISKTQMVHAIFLFIFTKRDLLYLRHRGREVGDASVLLFIYT
jgi:hypothetical protein